jgi:hypothetical protein
MGKHGKEKGEEKTKIVFQTVVKEIGEGDAKQALALKYDPVTERFDLHKDDHLVASSCFLGDCVMAAESYGVKYSDSEKKVTFKAVG